MATEAWQPLVHSGEGEGGASGERGVSTYAQHVGTARVGRRAGGKLLCDDPEGRDGGGGEAHEGRGMCVVEADSSCCVAETNATL